jgi:soluble lytic murein transglycosylase-like protein
MDEAPDAAPAADMPQRIPLQPVAKPVIDRSRAEICDTLAKAAQRNDLPVPFFIRLLFQESRFEPDVVSSAGAQGIAQFMPETASDEGLDNPLDPLQAIPASARLLKKLFEQFGNLGLAAAAYNVGPKTIEDWLAKKGKLPEETQGYVKTVTGRPAETWRVAKAGGTALSLPPRAPCKEAVPAAQTVTASNAPHDSHKRAKPVHRV